MSVPVPLRDDFDAAAVRLAAKASKDAAQTRRLLALAEIYDGGTRTDASEHCPPTLRPPRSPHDRTASAPARDPLSPSPGKTVDTRNPRPKLKKGFIHQEYKTTI